MALDFKAITNGLAARYTAAAITTAGGPPAGRKNVTGSTGQPPNNIPSTPYVIVWPEEGEITVGAGMANGEHTFLVTFYYSKSEGDLIKEATALQEWLGILLGLTYPATKLGLGGSGVMKALPVSWAIGTLVYAGDTYAGITITVRVWTEEVVVLVP